MIEFIDRKPRWLKWLIFVCLLGFIIRLLGIKYGLPYLSHPDEARIILDTLSMGHRFSLLPQMPDYALLYRYLLLFLYGVYFLLGRVLGWFSSSIDFALKFFIDPANIYLISRMVSVIFGTAIFLPAYFIGKRIFGRRETGFIASLFVLWEFQLLQHSQWALYSVTFCFVNLLAFYYMYLLMQNAALRNFILSGVFCGLAISVQNQGVFLLPPLVLSYFFVFLKQEKGSNKKLFIKRVIISFLFLSACALLGNFYWIFIFKESFIRMVWMCDVTRVGFSSAPPYTYNLLSMMNWFMRELIYQDLLLGLIMVAGFFYALLRRRKEDIVFLSFVVIYLYSTSKWGFRSLHDLLSLLPIMCLFGARFLVGICDNFKNKRLCYIIAAIAVLPLSVQAVKVDIAKMQKDTRIIAKEWIENNVPTGAGIGMDWPVLSVPLESEIPFLLRNPAAEKYYEINLKPLIGQLYGKYIQQHPNYLIDELIYWTDEPVWPIQMPQKIRLEAAKRPVCRDLYSRFIFKDIDTIINQNKIEYLVISSYTWTMFLYNIDPYKRNLFKPFIKDRPERNFMHAPGYIDDKRHGYLFYLAQQGRDFYSPLLGDELKQVRLIKEFFPINNLGPEIRIYQIIKNGR